jgi:hypothetical protein
VEVGGVVAGRCGSVDVVGDAVVVEVDRRSVVVGAGVVTMPIVVEVCPIATDVVDVDELVVVDVDVLVDAFVGSLTSCGLALRGPRGTDDVGAASAATGAVVVVVVLEGGAVINTIEVGPIRSGMRPSVSPIEPANKDTATTPINTMTTPLEAEMIADFWCHHPRAVSSYSGTSSYHSSSTRSSGASNEAALSGSGGGHIPALFHLARVPTGTAVTH